MTETEMAVGFEGMIGSSTVMEEVYNLTRRVAGTTATVLLTGETGTGKELVARALHRLNPPSHRTLCSRELRSVRACWRASYLATSKGPLPRG